jgi:hypothetical protein
MNMIKVSNIMGVDPKPFDPNTYEEEDTFVTDEFGNKKRIRLENNIVRWRKVTNPDGTDSVSNCTIVVCFACYYNHPFFVFLFLLLMVYSPSCLPSLPVGLLHTCWICSCRQQLKPFPLKLGKLHGSECYNVFS